MNLNNKLKAKQVLKKIQEVGLEDTFRFLSIKQLALLFIHSQLSTRRSYLYYTLISMGYNTWAAYRESMKSEMKVVIESLGKNGWEIENGKIK